MQTNRINGEATLALLQGRKPGAMVSPGQGGSVNQKLEAAEVQVGYHCLVSMDEGLASTAVDHAIDLLESQERLGHQLQEVWTDSHDPIHLRGMTALQLWCLRAGTGKLRVAGGKRLPELRGFVERWFEYHYTSCTLGLVPRGPLAGGIVLPCNRKSSSDKLGVVGGVPTPEDSVRNAWFALVSGKKPPRVGPHFFDLSADRPDTMAGAITRLVLASGGFGPNLKRGTAPKLIAPCEVERYDGGHAIRFPDGLPDSDAFSSPACVVDYTSGRYAFAATDGRWFGPAAEPVQPPRLEGQPKRSRLEAA